MTDANKNNTEMLLLRNVARVTQARVCQALGKDPAGVSRIFSGQQGILIGELGVLLDSLDLELIERGRAEVRMSREEYSALLLLAGKGLERMRIEATG